MKEIKNQRGGNPFILPPLQFKTTKPPVVFNPKPPLSEVVFNPKPPLSTKKTLLFSAYMDNKAKETQGLQFPKHQSITLPPIKGTTPNIKGGKASTSSSSSKHIKTSRTCKCSDGVSRTIYIRVKDNRECVKQKNQQSNKMTYVLVSKVHGKKHKKHAK
jgi:hypothetical protein